eukprot:UN27833
MVSNFLTGVMKKSQSFQRSHRKVMKKSKSPVQGEKIIKVPSTGGKNHKSPQYRENMKNQSLQHRSSKGR